MAINYLNSIDLNRNELQNAQLIKAQVENQPNNASAGTGLEGQLYYDTTLDVVKVWSAGSWSEVGGGVESVVADNSGTTYIDLTPATAATGAVTITGDLNAVDGTSVAATRFLSKDNTWDVPTYPSDANTTYDLTGVGSTNGTAGVRLTGSDSTTDDVLIVGGGTTIVTRSANTLTVTSNDEFDGTVTSVAATHAGNAFTASIGNTSTINPSVDITMAGAATDYINGLGNLTAFPAIPQGDITGIDAGTYITIDDPNTATPTVNALGTEASTPSRLVARDASGFGYVDTPSSGDSSEKIATTAFVQNATTGLLQLVGGFNASTGALASPLTGNLTSGAARVAVDVGDYYVVTVAGDFFGNAATPLTPGDSVIVQTQALTGTSVESDFIVVQSDTDLATASTVGLGNVAPGGAIDVSYSSGTATVSVEDSTASNKGAVIVDGDDPITVTYNSGTATVGIEDSAAAQKGAVIVSGGTGIDVAYASGTATVSLGAQSSLTFTNTGPATAGTSYPITAATHGLGSDSSIIMVQLVEVGSGETVYTDVVRGASGLITMTFAASQAINTFRALLQKIG